MLLRGRTEFSENKRRVGYKAIFITKCFEKEPKIYKGSNFSVKTLFITNNLFSNRALDQGADLGQVVSSNVVRGILSL